MTDHNEVFCCEERDLPVGVKDVLQFEIAATLSSASERHMKRAVAKIGCLNRGVFAFD